MNSEKEEKFTYARDFRLLTPEQRTANSKISGHASLGVKKTKYIKCQDCSMKVPANFSKVSGVERQLRNYAAFVGHNPEQLLAKIQEVYQKLEDIVDKDPSYTKLTNMIYLLVNIYKLKFGDKLFVAKITKNLDNPTMDIKHIMTAFRDEQRRINNDVVDTDVVHVDSKKSDTSEEGGCCKNGEGGGSNKSF